MLNSKAFEYLVAAYLPAALLPVIHILLGERNPYVMWVFMTMWIIYILILLILYYLSERGVE